MGEWYIIHTASGAEKKIERLIWEQVEKNNMQDFFEEILVPVISVTEVKRGKEVAVEKKLMPGYIFIKMRMTSQSWHLIKNIPRISKFLGSKTTPKPLSQQEIDKIFAQLESETKSINAAKTYDIGEKVKVSEGPFEGFEGFIEEIDIEKQIVKLAIPIFGKSTLIELHFSQINKKSE